MPLIGAERPEVSVMQQHHISALSIARTPIAPTHAGPHCIKRAIFMRAALSPKGLPLPLAALIVAAPLNALIVLIALNALIALTARSDAKPAAASSRKTCATTWPRLAIPPAEPRPRPVVRDNRMAAASTPARVLRRAALPRCCHCRV